MASPFGIEPLDKTLPSAPAIAAPTAGNTDPETTLLTILRQIGALQGQPLVPENNPLLQMAAGLSGFAAGTQGRPNPVLAELKADRATQMQGLLSTAQIAGTIDSMQHRRQQELLAAKREERTARTAEDRLEFDKKKFGFETGLSMTRLGKELGSADLLREGLTKQRESGIPISDEHIDILSRDTAAFENYQKRGKVSAAYIASGLTPPPGFEDPVLQQTLSKATPEQKSMILQSRGLDDLKIKGAILDHQIKEYEVREVQLRRIQETRPLTFDENAEFQAIVGSKNKSDVREIASGMREADRQSGKPIQPFHVYLTAAFDAKREPRDIEILRDALMRQNPGMTKDQATLAATTQQAEARVPLLLQQRQAQMQFKRLNNVIDEMEMYAKRLAVRGVFQRIAGMPKREVQKFLQSDPDIVGLSNASSRIATITRAMGEVGNLAEKEQERMIVAIPGIHDLDEIKFQKIRDLRALAKKNADAVLEIFTNPYSPTARIMRKTEADTLNPAGLADDPLTKGR